jgi:phenylacetic acid degradation operon negative regulatory protein
MYEIVNDGNIEVPNARRLILNLLLVAEGGMLSVAEAAKACALFDISENNVRVTLARLSQSDMVEAVGRGAYRLGPASRDLGADVAAWRSAEDRLRPWTGHWIAVSTGGLARSDRKALRARERALSMLGMRELGHGLYVRPDNFSDGVAAVRDRLLKLGLGADAAVFRASELDAARQALAEGLWPAGEITQGYEDGCHRLDGWLAASAELALDAAARESFLIGDDAIRRIVFDPLLPAPLIDEAARHAFIETVKRFDDAGRIIWMKFLATAAG